MAISKISTRTCAHIMRKAGKPRCTNIALEGLLGCKLHKESKNIKLRFGGLNYTPNVTRREEKDDLEVSENSDIIRKDPIVPSDDENTSRQSRSPVRKTPKKSSNKKKPRKPASTEKSKPASTEKSKPVSISIGIQDGHLTFVNDESDCDKIRLVLTDGEIRGEVVGHDGDQASSKKVIRNMLRTELSFLSAEERLRDISDKLEVVSSRLDRADSRRSRSPSRSKSRSSPSRSKSRSSPSRSKSRRSPSRSKSRRSPSRSKSRRSPSRSKSRMSSKNTNSVSEHPIENIPGPPVGSQKSPSKSRMSPSKSRMPSKITDSVSEHPENTVEPDSSTLEFGVNDSLFDVGDIEDVEDVADIEENTEELRIDEVEDDNDIYQELDSFVETDMKNSEEIDFMDI